MSLIELLPGVSSDLPDRVDPNTPPAISINGARNSASAFTIDGVNSFDDRPYRPPAMRGIDARRLAAMASTNAVATSW